MTAFDFRRYLSAKRTVDDRALNRRVWGSLAGRLPPSPHILEAACGVGTMPARMEAWGLPLAGARYLGVDRDPENILAAHAARAGERGGAADERSAAEAAGLSDGRGRPEGFRPGHERRLERGFETVFACEDVFNLKGQGAYDLLIAAAFLDLVALDDALPHLAAHLKPGGLGYFPLNFDGVTVFAPEHPRDDAVLTAYHASMDAPARGGHSRTGRRLFQALPEAGLEIVASGGSDWVVAPGPDGRYTGDEAYFLRHILHFFEVSCAGVEGIDAWLRDRRRQIEAGTLVYIAHQLDFLVRRR